MIIEVFVSLRQVPSGMFQTFSRLQNYCLTGDCPHVLRFVVSCAWHRSLVRLIQQISIS